MKRMDSLFNTIRQENEKQFIHLSKKIDRKHHIDSVRYSYSGYLLFDVLYFVL